MEKHSLFKTILEIKHETEKYIAFKANKISQFKKKWEMFEVLNLNLILTYLKDDNYL